MGFVKNGNQSLAPADWPQEVKNAHLKFRQGQMTMPEFQEIIRQAKEAGGLTEGDVTRAWMTSQ